MRAGTGIVKYFRPHILVAIAVAIAAVTGIETGLQNALSDLRFRLLPRDATGRVAVVAIDPDSIRRIGVWPWPRRLHGELIHRLVAAGAQDIALDIDFSTPSDPASDKAFADALQSAGGSVVLPSFSQRQASGRDGRTYLNRPLGPFADQSWPALVNVAVERDGRVRRYSFGDKFGGEFVPSMAAMLAGVVASTAAPFVIDFGIRAGSIPTVSYADVLAADPRALARLNGRKVIVGGTALELGDRFSVPNGAVMAGPVLQALAADALLQNRAIQPTSAVVTALGLAALALIMTLAWRALPAGRRVLLLVGLAAAIEATALVVQARLPVAPDTSLLLIAILTYLAAVALDEINIRGLLGRVSERRFQRIANALGDGLVCTDARRAVTVWNAGASAMFGRKATEMVGGRFEAVVPMIDPRTGVAISLADLPLHDLQAPGGKVVELEGRRASGEVFPIEACISGWQGADGIHYGAILRDISARKREAERIRYLAEYDTLTGLPNRHTLRQSLTDAIGSAASGPRNVALLLVGIDKFQHINDLLGHATGDEVLRAVADRLRNEAAPGDLVARLGGDEFAIVVVGADIADRVAALAQRIANAFKPPLLAAQREHRVSVRIGAAMFPEHGRTADELLGNSHLALCRAKATARGQHVLYNSAIRDELEARLQLEAELALAAARDEFELFYQPQVRLADRKVIGAEALIRWRHPRRGLVPSGEFMPVVNTSPSSSLIAAWVLRAACAQGRRWELAGHPLRIGVNLAPSLMQSGDLAGLVEQTLAQTGFSAHLLELEVTEDILLADTEKASAIFRRIQALGVRVVFDDFGTGYASLSYLRDYPLDGLKIDRSFVMGLQPGSQDGAIVAATIGLAGHLGISVIAEGIEDEDRARTLLQMGCGEGQGFHFGRPMPVPDFETRFFTHTPAEDAVTTVTDAPALADIPVGASACPAAPALAGETV